MFDQFNQPMGLPPEFACRSDNDGLWIWSDRCYHFLKGAVFCDLSPRLRDRLPASQRIRSLAGRWTTAEVVEALIQLRHLGLLVAVLPDTPLDARVELVGASPSLQVLLKQNFEPLKITLQSPEPELRLVFSHDYLQPELLEWIPRSATPTLLIHYWKRTLGLGPLFDREGSCFACLRHRLRLRQPHRLLLGPMSVPEPLRQDEQWVAARVASLCVEILAGRVGRYARELLQVDLASGEASWHLVPRRRDCPECAQPGARVFATEVRPIALHQHRSQSAEFFAESIAPELDPLLGLIETINFSQEGPVHFGSARHVSPHSATNIKALRSRAPLYASGKGKSAEQCRASCLGEAIERFALYATDNFSDECASFRSLGSEAIHPNKIMLYSQNQYRRHDPNVPRGPHFVPEPFDEHAKIAWRKVWSYSTQSWKLLPRELLRAASEQRFCNPCSNGVATGATREEALLQGLLELVERDSVALWWYPRRICPGVDLLGWDPPFVQALRDYYAAQAREFWLLDLSGDLALPAFAAISASQKGPSLPIIGFGCHWDAQVAARRALTEMNQLLPYFLSKAERVGRKCPGAETGPSSYDLKVEETPYLWPCSRRPPRSLADETPTNFADTLTAFEACQSRLTNLGLELLYFDMTPSEVSIPVARALVPGLRHHWPRFAPGRLYDSPLIAPGLNEDGLNPVGLAT